MKHILGPSLRHKTKKVIASPYHPNQDFIMIWCDKNLLALGIHISVPSTELYKWNENNLIETQNNHKYFGGDKNIILI